MAHVPMTRMRRRRKCLTCISSGDLTSRGPSRFRFCGEKLEFNAIVVGYEGEYPKNRM